MTKPPIKLNKLLESGIITLINTMIWCTVCNQKLAKNSTIIENHLKTSKHKRKSKIKEEFKNNTEISSQEFNDLLITLIKSNISLNVVNNNEFCEFIKKYCGREVPSFKHLSRYLPKVYNTKMTTIQNIIKNKNLYFILDEARDLFKYVYTVEPRYSERVWATKTLLTIEGFHYKQYI